MSSHERYWLEQRLTESRQRALELATRLEETDRRACAAEQELTEMTANNARQAVVIAEQDIEVAEKNVALGALARLLDILNDMHHPCPFCKSRGLQHKVGCELAKALAFNAVQKAVEAWKAKDAEIEHAHAIQSALLADIQQSNRLQHDAEAKLAVATGLLERYETKDSDRSRIIGRARPRNPECVCIVCYDTRAFLADPSQAAEQYREMVKVASRVVIHQCHACGEEYSQWSVLSSFGKCPQCKAKEQYHEAMAVRERVKAAIRHIQSSTPSDVRWHKEPLLQLQALLGDAAQEEQPVPSIEEMSGSIPNITGGLPLKDYLDDIRGLAAREEGKQ